MPGNIEQILCELKKGLQAIYGDARPPDSDIDVLIVLKGELDDWDASRRSSELIASLSLENDVIISRKFASETVYANSKMLLYVNVRQEVVAV